MSRIRSIHPGLWTDERFASLSPMARLLFLGIWTECDDQGSFEWSPLKLKMRLLPADAVDAGALMAELEAAGCVTSYELEGRKFGAVRNFCRFQRPKKPNSTYPQTDAVRNFVDTEARSTRDGSEPVENQFPTGGEKSRQMKEEGGRRDKETVTASGEVGSARAKRGAHLPSDFVVPPDWLAWATDDGGLAADEARRQASLFVDHWSAKAGKDGVKSDWQATWRNWCRRAPQFERTTARAPPNGGYSIGGTRLSSPC